MTTAAVILAAGLGKRMKSSLPKVLHPILGDPSLLWVLRALPAGLRGAVVVLHHGKEKVEAAIREWDAAGLLPCPIRTVDQGEPLGTGHAMKSAIPAVDELHVDRVIILCGDVPLIATSTVERLVSHEAVLLAMDLEDPSGYGRVIQHADGSLKAVVEHKDASEAQRAVKRVNGGAYTLPWRHLRKALGELTNQNAQREYYLTDAVVAVSTQAPVIVELCDPEEMTGMNSRRDQAWLCHAAQDRINEHWMDEGVTLLDPASTTIGPRVTLTKDVFIEAGVRLEGTVTVGEGTRIGQGTIIRDCTLGAGTEIRPYCVLQSSSVGEGVKLGPFAHLREGTILEAHVHVGNFVETKKTRLKAGAKANHLSYLGDCEVGERSNIGAGCITCNYDGFLKHRTTIGREVFVGSDCQLVAPVKLGDGSVIGAGTTVTSDVPTEALVLARAPLVVKEGGATRLRTKLIAKKEALKDTR